MREYLKKRSGCLLLFCAVFLLLCPWSVSRVHAGAWLYGAQLTGTAKNVYDALAGARGLQNPGGFGFADGRDSGGSSGEEGLRVGLSREYGMAEAAGLAGECHAGADAFLRDHSEIFWISGFDLRLGFQSSPQEEKQGEMTASYVILYPAVYYDGIQKEIRPAQAVIDRLVRSVRKCQTRYEKVKAAHDAVLKQVDYAGKGENQRWHHTVTGGLLDRYGHRGVCETYAKLFAVICRANDIPVILVTGGLKSENISHMWNYVQMEDGGWYLVDVTNDDQREPKYDYFLAGSGTAAFAGRVGTTHRPSGYLRAGQQEPFRLPVLSESAYRGTASRKLTVSKSKIILRKGKTYRISVKRKPWNADDALTYSSSDAAAVSVNARGKITARKKGKAVITIRSAGGKKARIRVTVR